MFNSFQDNVGMTPEQATEAVAYYRTLGKADGYTTGRGSTGSGRDHRRPRHRIAQATASSKPEVQVVALMEHFDLAPHMTAMVGSTSDEKTLASKSDIVAEALRRPYTRPESTRAVRSSSATVTTTSRAAPRRVPDLRPL